jgi:hypothetical protein
MRTNGLYCGKLPQLVSLISSSFMNFMMFYSWYSKGSNSALQDLFKIYIPMNQHILHSCINSWISIQPS